MNGPIEGLTRCDCGSKYWDTRTEWFLNGDAPEMYSDQRFVCHSCGEKFRPDDHN